MDPTTGGPLSHPFGDGCTVFMAAESGNVPCTEDEREAFLAYQRLYEIDQYYESIKDYTFQTDFLELSVEEVKAWRLFNKNGKMTNEENRLFEQLKSRLDQKIKTISKNGQGAFVRLSTRSPKDACDKIPERVIPLIVSKLRNASIPDEKSNETTNMKLIVLRTAFFECLRFQTGEEAMDVMSLSSRIVSDIVRAIDNLDKSPWNLKLIIREFVDIPISGELRGFVFKGELTVLSQYYCDVYFDELTTNKATIQSKVQQFFEKVKKDIKIDNYICDFVVLQDGSVKIVELNPWSPQTGACLFDWKLDASTLQNGPFQFRVLSSVPKHVAASLIPWDGLLTEAQSRLEKEDDSKGLHACVVVLGCAVLAFVAYNAYQTYQRRLFA